MRGVAGTARGERRRPGAGRASRYAGDGSLRAARLRGRRAGRSLRARRRPPAGTGRATAQKGDGGNMAVRIVRLGSARARGEGLRIGRVRQPPRGVPKAQLAKQNWYDVWLPELAPSRELVAFAQAAETPQQWAAFARRYRAEMAAPEKTRLLELLAALSARTEFSVGCYCADEAHCHRSVLRALLKEHGAKVLP